MKPKHWLGAILLGTGLGLSGFAFGLKYHLLNSRYQALTVMSGSMSPSIQAGSVIITKSSANYHQGDVITFTKEGSDSTLVSHRVLAKTYPQGPDQEPSYLTSGDANEDFDLKPVAPSQIHGKVILTLPYLGHLSSFAKTPKGFVALIIIPASIIIYEETKSLIKELKAQLLRFFSSRGVSLPKNFARGLLIFPALGLPLLFINTTGAFFSDQETSTQNIIAVSFDSTTTPTPAPSVKIVINEVYYNVDPDHGSETADEWVELYNPNSFAVDLKNWTLTDNYTQVTIDANKSIPANGFALITKSASTWQYWDENPAATKIELGSNIGNGLANSKDFLILKDNSGTSIDQIGWGELTGFTPTHANVSKGHSLEREPAGVDTDSAADFVDRTIPTP